MRLIIVFLALLPILVVHTTIFEARGTKRIRLSPMIDDYRANERTHHSSATNIRSRTNKNTPTGTKNIFGIDKRTPVTSTAYPWRAIGKLSTDCTGTLVGPDLVLTAAHCIIDPKTQIIFDYALYFYANMIDGKSDHQAWISHAWWGTNDPDKYRERDWALLRLDKKLGDTQGWFGIRTVPIDSVKSTLGTLAGYSSDFRNGKTAGVHANCSITKQVKNNFFLHNCHMTRGASGGPLFAYWDDSPYIYALNVAEYRNDGHTSLQLSHYTDANANIAIWSEELKNKTIELKQS